MENPDADTIHNVYDLKRYPDSTPQLVRFIAVLQSIKFNGKYFTLQLNNFNKEDDRYYNVKIVSQETQSLRLARIVVSMLVSFFKLEKYLDSNNNFNKDINMPPFEINNIHLHDICFLECRCLYLSKGDKLGLFLEDIKPIKFSDLADKINQSIMNDDDFERFAVVNIMERLIRLDADGDEVFTFKNIIIDNITSFQQCYKTLKEKIDEEDDLLDSQNSILNSASFLNHPSRVIEIQNTSVQNKNKNTATTSTSNNSISLQNNPFFEPSRFISIGQEMDSQNDFDSQKMNTQSVPNMNRLDEVEIVDPLPTVDNMDEQRKRKKMKVSNNNSTKICDNGLSQDWTSQDIINVKITETYNIIGKLVKIVKMNGLYRLLIKNSNNDVIEIVKNIENAQQGGQFADRPLVINAFYEIKFVKVKAELPIGVGFSVYLRCLNIAKHLSTKKLNNKPTINDARNRSRINGTIGNDRILEKFKSNDDTMTFSGLNMQLLSGGKTIFVDMIGYIVSVTFENPNFVSLVLTDFTTNDNISQKYLFDRFLVDYNIKLDENEGYRIIMYPNHFRLLDSQVKTVYNSYIKSLVCNSGENISSRGIVCKISLKINTYNGRLNMIGRDCHLLGSQSLKTNDINEKDKRILANIYRTLLRKVPADALKYYLPQITKCFPYRLENEGIVVEEDEDKVGEETTHGSEQVSTTNVSTDELSHGDLDDLSDELDSRNYTIDHNQDFSSYSIVQLDQYPVHSNEARMWSGKANSGLKGHTIFQIALTVIGIEYDAVERRVEIMCTTTRSEGSHTDDDSTHFVRLEISGDQGTALFFHGIGGGATRWAQLLAEWRCKLLHKPFTFNVIVLYRDSSSHCTVAYPVELALLQLLG